jgi:cysteine desulfurase
VDAAAAIYLDCAATTPIDPRVREAMWEALRATGNPASQHAAGRSARLLVDAARERCAGLLGVRAEEIVFTGSGTESNNLALRGLFGPARGGHLVTSAIEHPSVLEVCRSLERGGIGVTFVRPDRDGIVRPEALAAALRPETRLVSIMAANNVTGVIQPVAALAGMAHDAGALFHTDAVQAVGKLPAPALAAASDLLSFSAHKLHGPQGVGALFVRGGVEIAPFVEGGGQERGLRSGTHNVAGVAGLGAAAEIVRAEGPGECARIVALRERIIDAALADVPGAYVVGHRHLRLPGHVCLAFAGREADAIRLLLALDQRGIAVSSGSACSASHGDRPSHVLEAMGYDPIRARGALRITLGRFTTDEEVERLIEELPRVVSGQRSFRTDRLVEAAPARAPDRKERSGR